MGLSVFGRSWCTFAVQRLPPFPLNNTNFHIVTKVVGQSTHRVRMLRGFDYSILLETLNVNTTSSTPTNRPSFGFQAMRGQQSIQRSLKTSTPLRAITTVLQAHNSKHAIRMECRRRDKTRCQSYNRIYAALNSLSIMKLLCGHLGLQEALISTNNLVLHILGGISYCVSCHGMLVDERAGAVCVEEELMKTQVRRGFQHLVEEHETVVDRVLAVQL